MNKKSRLILFWLLVLVFFISTPIIIFYILGYRFNLKTKTIVQPGAILINIQPPMTPQVLMNQKPVRVRKLTTLLQNSFIIRNTIPGTYNISILRDNFESYNKQIIVKSLQISNLPNIVLLPKLSKNDTLFEEDNNIADFAISLNKAFIAYITVEAKNEKSLKIFDRQESEKFEVFKTSANIPNFEFSPSNKFILFKLTRGSKLESTILKDDAWILYDLTGLSFKPLLNLNYEFQKALMTLIQNGSIPKNSSRNFDHLVWHPIQEFSVFLINKDGIYLFNWRDKNIQQIYKGTVASPKTFGNNLEWINNDGEIMKYQPVFRSVQPITKIDFPETISQPDIKNCDLIANDPLTIKCADKVIYKDVNGQLKIISGVIKTLLSPDKLKIAILNNNNMGILPLKEIIGGFEKQKLEYYQIFNKPLNNFIWYRDSAHLFIQDSNKKWEFIEIDDRTPVNVSRIHPEIQGELLYDSSFDYLFYIDKSVIKKLDLLKPNANTQK